MLAVEGTGTEEVAELLMLSAEPAGRHEASEAAHTSYPSLDPPVVLFQSIIIGHDFGHATGQAFRGRRRIRLHHRPPAGRVGCGGNAVQQKHSQIDVLFTNAGGGSMLPLGAITEEQYEDTFGRNVNGVIFTVQKALSLLRDGAAVVLMGSTAGTTGTAAFSIYGASEASVRNLARSWTLDLKERGIRVNVVSPGPVKTPGLVGLAGPDVASSRAFDSPPA